MNLERKMKFSQSFIDFCKQSDSRIAKIIAKYLYGFNYTEWHTEWQLKTHMYNTKMFTDEEINYITFRTDGTISYLPAGRKHVLNDDGEWSKEGRQNGKPGRVIRKIFTPTAQKMFKDSEFEAFGNQYKSYYSTDYNFVMHERNKIGAIYKHRHEDGDGTLNNSCMRKVNRGYFEIYEKCEKLRILALFNKEGDLAGRALIWNLEHDGEPITLMDRIYTTREHLVEMFLSYAKANGFWRKTFQSHDRKSYFTLPNGTHMRAFFEVETPTKCEYYPYIDTFTYGRNGILSNSSDGMHYEYTCTGGSREGADHEGEVMDAISQEWIDEEDARYISRGEYAGSYSHYDNVVDVDDETYWVRSEQIIETGDNLYILKTEAHYCEVDECWYHESEMHYSEYDNSWYHENHCIDSMQGWILAGDADEVDGIFYHSECTPRRGEVEEPVYTVNFDFQPTAIVEATETMEAPSIEIHFAGSESHRILLSGLWH